MGSNYQRIQLRRGTISSFDTFNPVLLSGEPVIALENGSGIFKVGDGINSYSNIAGLRIDVDETITSGLAVYASGQAVRVSGAITTEINNLVDSAPGALNTLNEIAAAINDDSNFIGTFLASGHAYTNALGGVSGVLDTISGIAVYASGSAGGDVSTAQFDIASGIAVFSSGQSIALQTSVGLLNTSSGVINTSVGLLETSSGVINTSVGLLETASGNLNDRSHIVSGIAIFASGKALAGGGSGPSQSEFDIASGIAVFASGKALAGGGSGPSTAQHQNVSGVAVFASGQIVGNHINIDNLSGVVPNTNVSKFPKFIYKASGQTLNAQATVISNDLEIGSTPLGGFRTGSIGQHLTIISGISVYASGNAGGGGGDVSTAQFNIASGIAVFSSGQSIVLQTSTTNLNTASGALNTSVGLLNVASGALNTSVGLLQVASGALNTNVGLNTSNFQTLSGITTVSQSGNFGYHTYRSGGANSSASGNISGVSTMVIVDHGAYNSLEKQTNTLYFIPSGT